MAAAGVDPFQEDSGGNEKRTATTVWLVILVLVGIAVVVVVALIAVRSKVTQPQATVIAGTVAGLGATIAAAVSFWVGSSNRQTTQRQISQARTSAAEQIRLQRKQLEHSEEAFREQIARQDEQLETQRSQAESTRESERISDLRARYSDAAGQLGNAAPAVRLAGVYAMATLADDWLWRATLHTDVLYETASSAALAQAQVCVDVLCSYLRNPLPPGSRSDGAENVKAAVERRSEIQVRQAITKIVSSRLQAGASVPWSNGLTFDFSGAEFAGAHNFHSIQMGSNCRLIFDDCEFPQESWIAFDTAEANSEAGVSFVRARFQSGCSAHLNWSYNEGSLALFGGATFGRGSFVEFDGAHFNGGIPVFMGAVLEDGCTVDFRKARGPISRAWFHMAEVQPGAHLYIPGESFHRPG